MWTRMKKFVRESALGCTITKAITPDPVQWAYNNVDKTTPDQLIAGYIIQNIAKNFDNWKLEKRPKEADGHLYTYYPHKEAAKRYAEMNKPYEAWEAKYGSFINRRLYSSDINILYTKTSSDRNTFTVNGVLISDTDGEMIIIAYNQLADKHKKAVEAAAKAKHDMEINEKKWNLAENLLGMRRNEFGALVPIQTAE